MYVTITLIICLSVVFVITLGIVSNTLRDENFKTHFDKSNERLKRIIKKQHDELISYREAIKKNDANLERSLNVLASASDAIKTRISRLKDTEELLSMVKVELGDLNLGTSKKMDEAIRSFSSCVKKIENNNEVSFKHFEQYLVNRPSYLSKEEKKHFKEYMQSCARGYTFINNMPNKMDLDFVCVVDKALEFVDRDQWDLLYIKCPSEEEYANGQNTERNQ